MIAILVSGRIDRGCPATSLRATPTLRQKKLRAVVQAIIKVTRRVDVLGGLLNRGGMVAKGQCLSGVAAESFS